MIEKRKFNIILILSLLNIPISLFFSTYLHSSLIRVQFNLNLLKDIFSNKQLLLLFFFIYGLIEVVIIMLFGFSNVGLLKGSVRSVTKSLKTPEASGRGQHGTARWMNIKEFKKKFNYYTINNKLNVTNSGNGGGIVVGHEKNKKQEKIYYLDDNIHTLTIGATRSGKSRSVVLETIGTLALEDKEKYYESMIISDPKGELYDYTSNYLRNIGYKVITLDFKNPMKSSRYNFLQPVINAVNENDYRKAEEYTWDITQSLVGNEDTKMEKIWRDGEMSVIAGAIMTVVFENKEKPEYQNLTNVYKFIAEMCKTTGGTMPINKYIENLPPEHPASSIFSIARIAPEKTRGSFFTSALTTLRLFTSKTIYSMTCESDFDLKDIGRKRIAVFIILPDEKVTYYPLASLFVYQNYVSLVEEADSRGGELKVRVNFILDEFRKLYNDTSIFKYVNCWRWTKNEILFVFAIICSIR